MSESTKVRVKGGDRQLLKELQEMESVKEMAVNQGLIDDMGCPMSYEKVLLLAIPEDAEPLERPEEDMCWLNAGNAKGQITELAGENISNHEVVTRFARQFADQYGAEV